MITPQRGPGAGDTLDPVDRQIILATQSGLPLARRPYHALAASLGLGADDVMARLARMLDRGVIRRIAAVPNHYAIGYLANGMTVWDVDDDSVSSLGVRVGALDFVSHCYRRPRLPGRWRYNLFAMVHGRNRLEVAEQVVKISALLGDACQAHDVLFSVRILKKTGLRLRAAAGGAQSEARGASEPDGTRAAAVDEGGLRCSD